MTSLPNHGSLPVHSMCLFIGIQQLVAILLHKPESVVNQSQLQMGSGCGPPFETADIGHLGHFLPKREVLFVLLLNSKM